MADGYNPFEPASEAEVRAFNERLAQNIADYWRERGYDVSVRLTNHGFSSQIRAMWFTFQSNTLNGYPINRAH